MRSMSELDTVHKERKDMAFHKTSTVRQKMFERRPTASKVMRTEGNDCVLTSFTDIEAALCAKEFESLGHVASA